MNERDITQKLPSSLRTFSPVSWGLWISIGKFPKRKEDMSKGMWKNEEQATEGVEIYQTRLGLLLQGSFIIYLEKILYFPSLDLS